MTKRRVIVKGGGANLFYIKESSGRFWVTQKKVGIPFDSDKQLGNTRSLDDALSLIRSYSGRAIESID